MLTKHPLVFPSKGLVYYHAHHVSQACTADMSAVLLHYKFVGDFHKYVRQIVAESSFSGESLEYKEYLRTIEESGSLQIYSEGDMEFDTVEDLLDQEFLTVSGDFRQLAENGCRG